MGPELPLLSPDELASAGQALFGAGWRSQLAQALGVTESEVTMAALGVSRPPPEWRAKLIALAQDNALRAMETAGNLLCFGEDAPRPTCQPPLPRYA